MNTKIDPAGMDKYTRILEEYLKSLRLSPENHKIASEYLLSDDDRDECLGSVKREVLRSAGLIGGSIRATCLLELYRVKGEMILERCLKLLCAIGKNSASAAWDDFGSASFPLSADLDWRAKIIGREGAAVMAGESLAYGTVSANVLEWVRRNADVVPQVREYMSSCGFLMLCAAILSAEQNEDIEVAYVQTVCNVVGKMLDPSPKSDLELLTDYIRTGDPEQPVPIPSTVNTPAQDIPSALQAGNGVVHYVTILAGVGFLCSKNSNHARCLLRICTMLNPNAVCKDLMNRFSEDLFFDGIEMLIQNIPGGGASILLFFAKSIARYNTAVLERVQSRTERMKEKLSDFLPEAFRYADVSTVLYLKRWNGDIVPLELLRTKLMDILSSHSDSPERVDAFLMRTGSLAGAEQELSGIQGNSRDRWERSHLFREYVVSVGWDDFACRIAALYGLLFEGDGIAAICINGQTFDGKRLTEMAHQLLLRGFPAKNLMQLCSGAYESEYEDVVKQALRKAALVAAKPEYLSVLIRASSDGGCFLRSVALEALDMLSAEPGAKDAILASSGDSSKQIREQVAQIMRKHPEWTKDYKALLASKKAAVRQLAVEVLGRLGERSALEAALSTEKNAKVSDAILAVLGSAAGAAVGSPKELAEGIVKGGKLKKLSWLICDSLQTVRNLDGTPADDVIRNAILLSYCELGRIGRSDTAAELAKGLDAADLQKLAVQVYDLWFAAGAQAKNKWVLPFAAVFGGTAMTERLRKAIHDWPEHQRGAIACDAVMALAMSTDPAAIVIVDAISRKFKFRQVKQAAALALENAARELGITAEELADRIVPDLGFGKDGKRIFDYGKRSFTVRLTPTLELSITNDQGKTVKNLPAPGKTDEPRAADVYEEFKAMKKAIKTTVTAQRARLESALSVLRCWDTDRWQALFVGNPIMHQFAMSLIWGVYEDGKLTETFRYMEDGSFNTVDEEEYPLPENAKIGLVHPVELDADTLDGWKQQLEDYEIKQSIDQLTRTVHAPDQEKAGEKALEDFGGKMLNALSLSGKLLQQGWYRGSVVDGGCFYTFYREDATLGIGAELRFSGCAVGYDDGQDVTVYDIIFYTGTIHRGSYVYDTVPAEHILPLGQVPKRYYSEIVHQLTRATASSTETDEGWKHNRNDI